ncbi:F0F1 ATP synthase subunit B [Buchnera aphidicola (Ceratovacuna keduensis)]|uniref:F0F1 ATP synthase subunit B n=1 Tax=Buchnera aphidicola TaxID=9 RepID=UPI0031B8B04C
MNINATILGQIISFFLFVFFCSRYIWPNITKAIRDRKKEVSLSFKIANDAKLESIKIKKEAIEKINLAKKTAKDIIKNAKYDRNIILQAAILNAEQKRKTIISEGKKKLNLKKNIVFEDLKNETCNLSIFVAKKILKEYIKKNDIDKIFEK